MRKLILGGTLMSLCLCPSFASSFLFTTLDASTISGGPGPGATNTEVLGISNSGLMVGQYTFGGVTYGFTYNGTTFTIVNPSGLTIGGLSATGISYHGIADLTAGGTEIVGSYTAKVGGNTVSEGFTDIGGTYSEVSISGAAATVVNGVNDVGSLSGLGIYGTAPNTRAFEIIGGVTTSGLVCQGSANTNGFGINASNTMVGYCAASNGWIYKPGTGFTVGAGTTFPNDPFAGSSLTAIQGIDTAGDMVGYYVSGGDDFGFIYTASTQTWTSIAYPGAVNTEILGFNDLGELVGQYNTAAGGSFVGFYATPVAAGAPEPGTVLLTMAALGGLAFFMRRKRQTQKA